MLLPLFTLMHQLKDWLQSKMQRRQEVAGQMTRQNIIILMAVIFFSLKSFFKNEQGIHVDIYSDNPTTMKYNNAMGGTPAFQRL